MKCVIVVLALLCSAQALKMDRAPMSARARKHVEKFDAIDRKAGRPERSKMDRAEWRSKLETYTGDSKDITDKVAEDLFRYADDYGLNADIASCAGLHTNAVDIMLCVSDELCASNAMGLTDTICDEIDAFATDATDIILTTLDGAIGEAQTAYASIVAAFKDEKKAPFNWYTKTVNRMEDYLDYHGVIQYVQDEVDSYSSYCDDIANGAGAELFESNGITGTANNRASLLSVIETNIGNDQMGGSTTWGDDAAAAWNHYVANSKEIPSHVEKLLNTDIRSRQLKTANRKKWRKGQFRRIGRRPQ